MKFALKNAVLLTLALSAACAWAEESQFAYVYSTDLLPKGAKEVEQWMTWRHQKSTGLFDVLESRTEIEYGVTDQFQIAAYANYAWTRASHDGVDGATATFLEQLRGAQDYVNPAPGFIVNGLTMPMTSKSSV